MIRVHEVKRARVSAAVVKKRVMRQLNFLLRANDMPKPSVAIFLEVEVFHFVF
jgi:hypothetical protein